MFDLYGIHVYFDRTLVDRKQVRFPKTKRRRIRRKWAKRPENYKEFPKREAYRIANALYVHPDVFDEWCKTEGIKVKDGTDNLFCPAVENRAAQAVAARVERAMSEPQGIFSSYAATTETPAPSIEGLKELMEKAKGFQRPTQMDFLRQPLPMPEPDCSFLKSEERFVRQEYTVRVPSPFLLTSAF
jgi:hypothetical protein